MFILLPKNNPYPLGLEVDGSKDTCCLFLRENWHFAKVKNRQVEIRYTKNSFFLEEQFNWFRFKSKLNCIGGFDKCWMNLPNFVDSWCNLLCLFCTCQPEYATENHTGCVGNGVQNASGAMSWIPYHLLEFRLYIVGFGECFEYSFGCFCRLSSVYNFL